MYLTRLVWGVQIQYGLRFPFSMLVVGTMSDLDIKVATWSQVNTFHPD